jgi:hypothetical protein
MILDYSLTNTNSLYMKTITFRSQSGIIRTATLLSMLLILTQCVGPRGPRGYDGQNGQDGIDGEAFAYSAIYDVDANEWQGDADGYRVYLDVPEITDDIYYNGAVLVYRLIEVDPKSFNLLPYTYVDNGFTIYMDFDAYVGGLDLIYKEILDGVNDTYAPENLMSFKVVIIEGIPLAQVKDMVDIKNYNAVVKRFNINVDKQGYQKIN